MNKQYDLLKYHMNANPSYLFGHAEIAGLLANNDPKVSTFSNYVKECGKRGVSHYNQDCYNRFMEDCGRTLKSNVIGNFFKEDIINDIEQQEDELDYPQ